MAEMDQSVDNAIIIDNIPCISAEKIDKLSSLLLKIIKEKGELVAWELVKNEDGGTKGYAFVEYASRQDATNALSLDGKQLDKVHRFKVCGFADWLELKKVTEEYKPSTSLTIVPKENLQQWLIDPTGREQYMVYHGDTTELIWNDPMVMAKAEAIKKRKGWTDSMAKFSPKGNYLTTFHSQGIQLWGGENMDSLCRFAHSDVQLIDFSPNENFLVTWGGVVQIWDVKSQKKIKNFKLSPDERRGGWPIFKWSPDEQFFARVSDDSIFIYDSSTMQLVTPDRRKQVTFYVPDVVDIEWSPSDNIIAYWTVPQPDKVGKVSDKPSKINLDRITKRKQDGQEQGEVDIHSVSQKNFFMVNSINAKWQNKGEYLCVKVDRLAKVSGKEKARVTNFEMFRIPNNPKHEPAVEVMEMKSEVIAFAWEPSGQRFGVIQNADKGTKSVSFYTMGAGKSPKIKKLITLEDRTTDHLYWSPRGTHCILATLGSGMSQVLDFYNTQQMESMGTAEHYMCTDVDWDPSGRYVISSVSSYRHNMENGYCIWTFQGKEIIKVFREKLWMCLFRPRPPSLLSEDRMKKISKGLTMKAQQYEQEQQEMEKKAKDQLKAEREKKLTDFRRFYAERKASQAELTETRRSLRGPDAWNSDDDSGIIKKEEEYEEVVDVHEEILADRRGN